MADLGASILAKLKNKAKESDLNYQHFDEIGEYVI